MAQTGRASIFTLAAVLIAASALALGLYSVLTDGGEDGSGGPAVVPKDVIAHSDMAPDRKSDPGRRFDWKSLADKGLSIWPEAALPGDFLGNAAAFGYPVELGEATILDAFRQRFRPEATGPIGPADLALMAGLGRHYPADVTARIARRVTSRPVRPMG